MPDEQISLDGEGTPSNSKKKLIIIIVAVLLVLGAGVAAYVFFFASDDSEVATEVVVEIKQPEQTLSANYVAMPRPFVFNVMEGKRDRLVQIKVQLMVRGNENATLAKKHIPLLEGTLVSVFSAATAAQLRSPEGKEALRKSALVAINEETKKREGKEIVHTVLFTGFVLQ
ncbi:flagellar basal body-associated protein FliL [Psychromonas marina]|uniref:Flagellar protein FliL n=1 Tax=Psychromonas marina TaxID=88364 RepID=A0ABQ6DWH0_9GAMM|nr:flagellar basal body-associated protein FliL [Psychromonas marina]GLS89459.1 flagellar basal body-associated protein FliL [Psychromonas marina]